MTHPADNLGSADRARVKRLAASALRQAGRTHLADIGVQPYGSSPRQWIGDHGWWLINVEFQASSWSVGSYLNVGVQYLWTTADFRSFGHADPRVPIPGRGQFVDLEGPEAEVRANADAVGRGAREAVITQISQRRSDDAHLHWLSESTDAGLWDRLDSAIASALLARGNEALRKFASIHVGLDRSTVWQDSLAGDLEHLTEAVLDPDRFRREIDERIATTRDLLRLPLRDVS